jgi:hypothetical protein
MRRNISLNPVGFLAGVLIAVSLAFPLWAFRLEYMKPTNIYAYVISGPISEYIGYERNKLMPLLTGVIVACAVFCLVGSFMKGKTGRILLASAGVLVSLCIWRFVVRMQGIADYFSLPLQGTATASAGAFAKVEGWTWFQPGFWLLAAGGVLALIAFIFHRRLQLLLSKSS